jgi:DNA-binding LytR/AlgR family response regulator
MKKQKRIFICEDELLIAEYLKEVCLHAGFQVSGIATSYEEAIAHLNDNPTDLALLDIELKGNRGGIEIGRWISRNLKIPFIYLTAYSDANTINMAINSGPYVYLIKPIEPAVLIANIKLAITQQALNYSPQVADKFFLDTDSGKEPVILSRLLWVESADNYSVLNYVDGRHQILRSTLSFLESALPSYFIRIHRSYLINIRKVNTLSSSKVRIASTFLPVGRTYKDALKKYLDTNEVTLELEEGNNLN